MKKVEYIKDGVLYSTVIKAFNKAAVQIQMLKKGVGMSQVKSIQDIMRQDTGVDGDAQRLSQLCWMFFLKIIDDQDQQLEVMQDAGAIRGYTLEVSP